MVHEFHAYLQRRRRTVSWVFAALVVVLVLAGCSSSDDESEDAEPAASATAPERLPSSPEQLAGRRRLTGPTESVYRLWYSAQWGSLPDVVSVYAPGVRSAISASDIAGIYSQARDTFVRGKPEIIKVEQQGQRAFVAVRITQPDTDPRFESYTVRRTGAEWLILYDTYLDRALSSYVQNQTQQAIDPRPGRVSPRAVQAGQRASRAFRAASLRTG